MKADVKHWLCLISKSSRTVIKNGAARRRGVENSLEDDRQKRHTCNLSGKITEDGLHRLGIALYYY